MSIVLKNRAHASSGLYGYIASAAFIGGIFGGMHTHKQLSNDVSMPKRVAFVCAGAVTGALINPIAIPFYPYIFLTQPFKCPFPK